MLQCHFLTNTIITSRTTCVETNERKIPRTCTMYGTVLANYLVVASTASATRVHVALLLYLVNWYGYLGWNSKKMISQH